MILGEVLCLGEMLILGERLCLGEGLGLVVFHVGDKEVVVGLGGSGRYGVWVVRGHREWVRQSCVKF